MASSARAYQSAISSALWRVARLREHTSEERQHPRLEALARLIGVPSRVPRNYEIFAGLDVDKKSIKNRHPKQLWL